MGYRPHTRRDTPSLEIGRTAFGRDFGLGWTFTLRYRAQIAIEARRTHAALRRLVDTVFELQFRCGRVGQGARNHQHRRAEGNPSTSRLWTDRIDLVYETLHHSAS